MPKRTNIIDYVEFPAARSADLIEAKHFYSTVFGWSFKDWGEDYIDTADSGLGSGFNADDAHRPDKPLVVVYVSELEEARSRAVVASIFQTRWATNWRFGPIRRSGHDRIVLAVEMPSSPHAGRGPGGP